VTGRLRHILSSVNLSAILELGIRRAMMVKSVLPHHTAALGAFPGRT
jgi:hypothetical protein